METVCNLAGFGILAHAMYSANQYKALTKIVQVESSILPIDILVQCAIAFGIIISGQLLKLNFKPAILSPNRPWISMDEFMSRPDFMLFKKKKKTISN